MSSVASKLNKFLTSPLRGSLKICNTTTIIFRNMPVLPEILRISGRTGILWSIAVSLGSAEDFCKNRCNADGSPTHRDTFTWQCLFFERTPKIPISPRKPWGNWGLGVTENLLYIGKLTWFTKKKGASPSKMCHDPSASVSIRQHPSALHLIFSQKPWKWRFLDFSGHPELVRGRELDVQKC